MEMREKLVKSEKVFEGKIINLKKETVLLPNGKEAEREIVEHPGGVSVVALDDEKNVYMVRQYRRPFDDVMLEIPAGKLNYGEDSFECGKRELEEETGMLAERFDFLGQFRLTPGFCNELHYIYLARNLKKGVVHPDEDEFLEIEKIPFEELVDMIMSNKISDAKTVMGILKASEFLKREQKN